MIMKNVCAAGWLVAVLVVSLGGVALAAAPNFIPLQGVLEDDSGTPVTGLVSVRFALYTSATGGSALWSESQSLTVDAGLFVAYLGSKTTLDLSLFQSNGNLWLGIQLGSDPEMERVFLGSAPFSAYSEYCGHVPNHTHGFGDISGTLPPADLPAGVALGPQGCSGTDKVMGLDSSGKLICAADEVGSGGATYLAGFGLNLSNYTFSVDTSLVQSRVTGQCASGNFLRQILQDGNVVCEQESAGQSYSAGFGLSLNGTTFAADPAQLQARVTGSCAPAGAVQSINQDGSVGCTGGVTPELKFDSGWTSYPAGTKTFIDHGQSGLDFVFGMVRGGDQLSGLVLTPAMGANCINWAVAYDQLSGTQVGLNGGAYIVNINNLGDRNNILLYSGEIRLMVFNRAATYDSGWFQCAANNTYPIINTNTGVFPHFALLEVAQNIDGSGWRVPAMSSTNLGCGGGWIQTALVQLSANSAVIRTHNNLAYFRDINGTNQSPTTGYCRMRLYNWQPDYDSGWVSISTTAGDRDKRFRHDLGRLPSLVMLYVAQNSDGSGWCLPAMSADHYSYSYGTGLYSLDDRWAVIKGGATSVASFVDAGGTGQSPTSGYVRFLAWR